MKATIIQAEDLWKEYLVNSTKVTVLQGVNLSIQQGDMVSLVGPSGSGKTTLLTLLSGLEQPSAGRVNLDGVDITDMDETQLAHLRRDKVGFIFQQYNLLPLLTALENVELPCLVARMGARERRQRAHWLLERVGLDHRADHKPSQLSGGEQQRVAIARALMNHPRIVFADEPTGNVDSHTGQAIMELVRELNREQGVTFIIATHDMGIARMTERTYRFIDGQLASHPLPGT